MAGFGGLLDSNSREMFVRAAFSSGNALFPSARLPPSCPRRRREPDARDTPVESAHGIKLQDEAEGGGESGSKDRRRKMRRAAPGLYQRRSESVCWR